MPKLIGIFGGTFDPVHYGHTETIRSLIAIVPFDEIRVIPNGVPPHRSSLEASTEDRLSMVSIAFSSLDNIIIDNREILREGPSYAIDTAKEVIELYQEDCSVIWIMGTDAFSSIDLWYKWREFIDLVNIIVMTRPDVEVPKASIANAILKEREIKDHEKFFSCKKGKILFVKVQPINVSSTKVRESLFLGKEVNQMIFSEVKSYIKLEKLYLKD